MGRYPAYYLIGRIPIRYRKTLWWNVHAYDPQHRVLIHLSMAYPRVTGKLDTRYAPVRRSPADMPESISLLPLDLHVLSL